MTEGSDAVAPPVAAPVPLPEGQAQQADQPQQVDWKEQLKSMLFRMVFFWMVMNWMKGMGIF